MFNVVICDFHIYEEEKRMKKRIFALMLVFIMLLSCVACGDKESASVEDDDNGQQTTTVANGEEPTTETPEVEKTLAEKISSLMSGIELTGTNAVELEVTNVEMGKSYEWNNDELVEIPGTMYDLKLMLQTDTEAKNVALTVKYAKAGSVYKDMTKAYFVDETLYIDVLSLMTAMIDMGEANSESLPNTPTGYLKLTKEEIQSIVDSMNQPGIYGDMNDAAASPVMTVEEGEAENGFDIEEILDTLQNTEIAPILYTELVKQASLYVGSISDKLPEGFLAVTDNNMTVTMTPENIDELAKAVKGSDLETYAKAYANAIKDDELGAKLSSLILENVDGLNDKLAKINTDGNSATEENAGEYIKVIVDTYEVGFGLKLEMKADGETMKLSAAIKKETASIVAPSNTYSITALMPSQPLQ